MAINIECDDAADALFIARNRRRMTKVDLARVMGITRETVARHESRATQPTAAQLAAYARALGVRFVIGSAGQGAPVETYRMVAATDARGDAA